MKMSDALSMLTDGGIQPLLLNLLKKLGIYSGTHFYETKVGIKSVGNIFDSTVFARYCTRGVCLENSGLTFEDLLLPPDGLKDCYSFSGRSILDSPHIQLIHDLVESKPSSEIAYLQYARAGILDNRRKIKLSDVQLRNYFQKRMAQVEANKRFDVFVYQPLPQSNKLIIVDGKHRVALAACLDRPELLQLNYVTVEPFRHPYFETFYQVILRAPSTEYAINQQVISLIRAAF